MQRNGVDEEGFALQWSSRDGAGAEQQRNGIEHIREAKE